MTSDRAVESVSFEAYERRNNGPWAVSWIAKPCRLSHRPGRGYSLLAASPVLLFRQGRAMTATVLLAWTIFGGLTKPEIIGADLVLLIVVAIMICARWRRKR
jgi:hypothetical protein